MESITLDESYDDIFVDLMQKETFEISGRTLLFSTKNNNSSLSSKIYAFNIQDCTQDMPTQSPTLSPSSPPTVSSLPTIIFECFVTDDGGRRGVLYKAVRSYVDQDCANNKECDIGQTYGWPMNSWCVGNVKDMSYLFETMSKFESMSTFNEDISDWDTSSVTDMSRMFNGATSFNGNVSNFDTGSATDMSRMFQYAKAFNGNVSYFNTSSVTDMRFMFAGAGTFNGDVSNFNTSSVTDMGHMFWRATSFNGDVSTFDTSSITDMSGMFYGATAFNQDVSNFNTSSVTNMFGMFFGASSFNQDLCSWQDNFPYTVDTGYIFTKTSCTYQDEPQEDQNGPFCASECEAPSISPSSSSAPTTSPKPTQSPTISSSPTETCYWVDIAVAFDDYPEETSWDIQKIDDLGDDKIVLKTVNGTSDDANKVRTESMCLEGDREYQFTIYDEYGD